MLIVLDTDVIFIKKHSIANGLSIPFLHDASHEINHLQVWIFIAYLWRHGMENFPYVLHWSLCRKSTSQWSILVAKDRALWMFSLLLAQASRWTNGRIETAWAEMGSNFITYHNFPILSA